MAVYLDYAATTPVDGLVKQAMLGCMSEIFTNPSAAYSAAGAARRVQRLSRQTLGQMLGCDPNEVFFTSGGTEGNNWAALICRGRHAVVSAIEHASVLESVKAAASQVTYVQPDENGVIHPEAVERAMRPDTALVSVQWANNETGVLQPVRQIARIAHAHGAYFHTDAVQAFGHTEVDVKDIDLLTLSAHKFYGPRGAGCLYVRTGTPLPPLLYGGGQEGGMRAGTENTPAICGLGKATELAREDMALRAEHERDLLALFLKELDGCAVSVLGADVPRLPKVLALLTPGHESEPLIAKLDLAGIQVSGGAACAAGQTSHVYRAMGLSEQDAKCVLRISVGRGTSREEIITAAKALKNLLG